MRPAYQRNGLASSMLRQFVLEREPEFLTTYTRNPSILRMMMRVTEALYPLDNETELRNIALAQPNATFDSVVYHKNRYGENGLFGGTDPAERPIDRDGVSLKELYPGLQSLRNSLIVAARPRKEQR